MKKMISFIMMMAMIASNLSLNVFAYDKGVETDEVKVSVIIPVYNVEPYLMECMDSLVNQTLKDIEIICIDDCSTDNSFNILKEYQEKDSRIKLIKQRDNGGAYVARNVGLKVATGEYVGFADPDDYLELNAFEVAYSCAKKNDADIAVFGGEIFGRNNNFAKRVLTTKAAIYENDSLDALFNENGARPFVWNKIYKRKMLLDNNIKFEEERNGCDNVFCFYVFPIAEKIIFMPDKLYHYRIGRPGNAGKDVWNNRLKNIEMSIKTNKYIINKWISNGYAKQMPKKFLKYYVDLYFNKIINFPMSLKEQFSKKVFEEIFTEQFFNSINEIKVPEKLEIKMNRLKSFIKS